MPRRRSVLQGLRDVLGETGPERRVSVEPFDPRRANPTRMARGLVVNLAIFGGTMILIALLGALTVSSFLVSQRTRSIGIRRALGATRRHIGLQFVVEAVLLAVMGGVVGVGLGSLVTAVYATSREWTVAVPAGALGGGVGVALAVGALAGLYPAFRAARLAPADAVRGA